MITDSQLPETLTPRIDVTGGGCSGFEYKFDFDKNINEETDGVRVAEGLRSAVDKKSALYRGGTVLDEHESFEKQKIRVQPTERHKVM